MIGEKSDDGCVFCNALAKTADEGLVLWRSASSFVILNKADGNVSAQIHLQGAPAGGSWRIELDQRPLEGCNPIVEGTITTNKQGNGNAHVSEPILPAPVKTWRVTNHGMRLRTSAANGTLRSTR